MALNERQNEILKLLKENKHVNATALAKQLYVSEATIRRDLKEMHSMGLLERTHGGALLTENADEISMFFRIQKNAKEKEQIATTALSRIPSFHSVFIDSSSTALALAERLNLSFKTVVTNGLHTALQLSKKENIHLMLIGGNVLGNTNAATGSYTCRQLSLFSFDLMICSCAATFNGECFERSIEQAELKRTAFSRSKQRVLLVDHTKFENSGTYFTSNLDDFDLIICDQKPPETIKINKNKFLH